MNEGDLTSELIEEPQLTKTDHVHTWAATPTGDDAFLYTCIDCGATKSEPPTA